MESEKPESAMHAYLLSAGAALGLLLTAVGTLLMALVMVPVEVVGLIWDRLQGRPSPPPPPDWFDDVD